jgi:hypothetical protein
LIGKKEMSRLFHVGDILSITTGKLVSTRLMEGVHDILNFMTSETLSNHQLKRASQICKPELMKQLPVLGTREIAVISVEELTGLLKNKDSDPESIVSDWLSKNIYPITGEFMNVQPLDVAYPSMDPAEEMEWMQGSNEGIIVIPVNSPKA